MFPVSYLDGPSRFICKKLLQRGITGLYTDYRLIITVTKTKSKLRSTYVVLSTKRQQLERRELSVLYTGGKKAETIGQEQEKKCHRDRNSFAFKGLDI